MRSSHGEVRRLGRQQLRADPWDRPDAAARPRRFRRPRLQKMRSGLAVGFFFASPQRPFETAPVDRNSEVFLNRLNAPDSGHCWLCRPQARYVVENIAGHLVATLGTTLTGQQSSQASPAESTLRLIERGPRDSKGSRRIENRHRLGAVPPQHFVADLKKISGIEERVLFEQRIGNSFWVWIESAGAF